MPTRAKSLGDWILLWFFRRCERRHILGVPVGVPADLRDGDAVFAKITGAFELLRAYGGRSLDEMRRHTNGVFVWTTAGARGECILERGWWFSKKHTYAMKARFPEESRQPLFTKARMRDWMPRGSCIQESAERKSKTRAFVGNSPLRDALQNRATWPLRRSDNYVGHPVISPRTRRVSAHSRS
jgi:hypothetical protein